jgi:hypothetical protein
MLAQMARRFNPDGAGAPAAQAAGYHYEDRLPGLSHAPHAARLKRDGRSPIVGMSGQ